MFSVILAIKLFSLLSSQKRKGSFSISGFARNRKTFSLTCASEASTSPQNHRILICFTSLKKGFYFFNRMVIRSF
jgi:hypothetical protein